VNCKITFSINGLKELENKNAQVKAFVKRYRGKGKVDVSDDKDICTWEFDVYNIVENLHILKAIASA